MSAASGTPGLQPHSAAMRALCEGAQAHRAALHLATKEAEHAPNGSLGEGRGAPSPRPPLSPSHFNAATSPSPTTPAGGPTRRSKRRPGSVGAAALLVHSDAGPRPISAAGGASPIAPDALRSPRDPMNIAHLLSSTRSPWSPRHFGGRAGWDREQPPRMTNRFHEGSSLTKPMTQTGSKVAPQSGKKPSAGLSASARMQPSSSNQSSYRAIHADLDRAAPANAPGKAKVEELDEGEDMPMACDEQGPDLGDGDVVGGGSVGYLPVQLFVAAIGDGELNPDTPMKMRDILQQVIKKVSKEQNTVVNVKGEGPLHIQLRVFVASSVEARALKDYIHANQSQTPCPFIMLAKQLPMAVAYDSAALNPAHANVADRLRKQAKTRAIKLLREVIWDESSGVTAAMLRGREGPLVPSQRLEALIMKRALPLESQGARFITFPAVRRQGEGGVEFPPPLAAGCQHGVNGAGAESHRRSAAEQMECETGSAGRHEALDSGTPSLRAKSRARNPDLPPTPCAAALMQHRMPEQHFPVSLTVIAIGEGSIVRNTQPKLLNRLKQLMSKVPKEHHCSIDLPKHGCVPLRLRLFVTNSEDAKAAREYVSSNQSQRPTPFVILSHALPIAVSYDSRNLDVSDANVVDCLRKQAKTRAVKLIKEVMADPLVGVTLNHLRGHEGAEALAQVLQAPLMRHATSFGGGKSYISFPARNRQAAENSSANTAGDLRGEMSAPKPMSKLDSLAHAALLTDEMENGSIRRGRKEENAEEAACSGGGRQHFTMSLQRVCEMCRTSHDGSYGTGRFCSKSCRYEAHALNVAQQRRTVLCSAAGTTTQAATTPAVERLQSTHSSSTHVGVSAATAKMPFSHVVNSHVVKLEPASWDSVKRDAHLFDLPDAIKGEFAEDEAGAGHKRKR